MNDIKITDTEVKLSDLTYLGRQGNVTARLDDGSTVTLIAEGAIKVQTGYINGEKVPVQVLYSYRDLYAQIRTIKRGSTIVARRTKFGSSTVLRLTGQGYFRPKRKNY